MTPEQVEHSFNADLIIRKGRGTHLLAFIDLIRARSGRGFRPKTKGRVSQGRTAKPVLMFTYVLAARMPKLLDLDGPAKRWEERFAQQFLANLEA